jgi:hypothetical protein
MASTARAHGTGFVDGFLASSSPWMRVPLWCVRGATSVARWPDIIVISSSMSIILNIANERRG